MEDDETPQPSKDVINIGEVYSKEDPEYDPEYTKMIEALEDIHEVLGRQDQSDTVKKETLEKMTEELMRKYPDNPLGPCKNIPLTCRDITKAFGEMTYLGYGDLQELCDLTAFHEALERMDLDECEEILSPKETGDSVKVFLNKCLLINLEDVVRDRLINDGEDEEQAQDTFIYIGEGKDSFFSPFDYEWRGPLAEKADKAFKEE